MVLLFQGKIGRISEENQPVTSSQLYIGGDSALQESDLTGPTL